MKKVFSLFLVALFVFSVVGTGSVFAEEKNYIANGDFASDLTNWSKNNASGEVGEITVAEENGNKYVKIVSTASTAVYIKVQEGAAVKPGDRVILSFDLRIVNLTEGASARIAIDLKDKNNNTIESKPYYDFFENRGEWVRHEIDLLIPDNAPGGLKFDMRVRGGKGGEVHFDNVAVTKSDKDETTLRVGYGDLKLDRIPDGYITYADFQCLYVNCYEIYKKCG